MRVSLGGLGLLLAVGTGPAARADEVFSKTRVLGGERFTFVKRVDEKGAVSSTIVDQRGMPVKALPVRRRSPASDELARLLARPTKDVMVKVNVALQSVADEEDEAPESGSLEMFNRAVLSRTMNGKDVSESEALEHDKRRFELLRGLRLKTAERKRGAMESFLQRHKLDVPELRRGLDGNRQSLTLELPLSQVRQLLEARDSDVLGVELHDEGEDDITGAMAATSISSSALPNSSTRGSGVGIYMTESGCAAESRITNYDRLAGSETDHSRNVGAIIRAVSPESFLYCRGGAVLPQSSDLDGVGGNPAIHIVTRSHSNNDNTNYTTVDRDWDDFVYDNNVATFNSGGNTGDGTGNVRSPGKGLNIVTVGNYRDSTSAINSSSPFNDPETGNDKPELSAPGTSVTAGGFTMTGTSQSTPHAAAFAADMMSSSTYLQYRPYLVKAKIMAGATDSISGGYSKVGLGGIDFASAQWSGYWQYYSGGNGSFASFDAGDGNSDGYITKQINISSSWNNVRVVISWLSRGSYTYSHRDDAHPIGMDLDMLVYDPAGRYVGGSLSWDNGFEVVNFKPTMSGTYSFKINRFANRDTSCRLRLGMYVNYYN
jgi:hypothetical protein